jgi:hypothetical protein
MGRDGRDERDERDERDTRDGRDKVIENHRPFYPSSQVKDIIPK